MSPLLLVSLLSPFCLLSSRLLFSHLHPVKTCLDDWPVTFLLASNMHESEGDRDTRRRKEALPPLCCILAAAQPTCPWAWVQIPAGSWNFSMDLFLALSAQNIIIQSVLVSAGIDEFVSWSGKLVFLSLVG